MLRSIAATPTARQPAVRHVSALVGSAAVFLGGSTAASAAAGTAGRTPTGPQGGYNDPEEGDITNESEAQHQQDRENAAKLKRAQERQEDGAPPRGKWGASTSVPAV
ncbi:hypothetical protein D9Q98_008853 [Chlorella vulgaris]|uniref:Uncharacterized protein n=1 Tax=Chlorella vulgaris TaxID=3077 RepID=A0A9D4TIT9_CHLVU|nr:hypothetical protein D9Q98_008853 [Chlorella vulgaris]